MQSTLVAIILALAVLGILVPLFRRDVKAVHTSFNNKPESLFMSWVRKTKDYLKNVRK